MFFSVAFQQMDFFFNFLLLLQFKVKFLQSYTIEFLGSFSLWRSTHFRGSFNPSSWQMTRMPRGGEGAITPTPDCGLTALSGVNCTACVKPLRGLAYWDYRLNFAMMQRARAMPTVGGSWLVRLHLPSERIFAYFPSVESMKEPSARPPHAAAGL